MSWYIDKNGRKVWAESHEIAYTVDEPEEKELAVETLTYLTASSNKTVFAEHTIDDDGDRKTKRAKEKQAGRQRGYVVRVEQDEKSRVHPAFRSAAAKLLSSGIISRLDIDETANTSRKKKGAAKEEEESQANSFLKSLGVNECRVVTTARCQHNAHGVGFRVEVAEGGTQQRIHMFTSHKLLTTSAWYAHLVEALEATGSRVMMGRLPDEEPPPASAASGGGSRGKTANDEVRKEEDAWLESVLGRCMVGKASAEAKAVNVDPGTEDGCEAEDKPDSVAPKKAAPVLPPWLRKH